MSNVTNIKHARELRAVGLPVNCEVIDGGELPAPVAKAMNDGFNAALKFRTRIYSHLEHNSASTMEALQRAFRRFMQKTEPPKGDTHEAFLTAAILTSEFAEIRDQWSPIFADLEYGEPIDVDLRQMWPFVPTEATKRRQQHPEL